MPSIATYYYSMTREDMRKLLTAVGSTLFVGGIVLWLLFQWLNKKLNTPAPQVQIKRRPPQEVEVKQKTTPKETKDIVPADGSKAEGEPPATTAAHTFRHIPRGAQAALVERGNRLLEEKNYSEALTCFLSLLHVVVESSDNVLPSQLTDCLRGVGKSYLGLGQGEVAVKFLQAERRVFEEMVVQAAFPNGGKNTPNRSIIASLLGKKSEAAVPRRCFTLSEVAEACQKLGYSDIALAYRVKAAALRQKISGEPLDPESEEAAQLAQSLNEFQARKSATASERESASARMEIEEELKRRVEKMQSTRAAVEQLAEGVGLETAAPRVDDQQQAATLEETD